MKKLRAVGQALALLALVIAICIPLVCNFAVYAEETAAADSTCQNCDNAIPKGAVICSKCGHCAECNTKNPVNGEECTSCGAKNADIPKDPSLMRDKNGYYGKGTLVKISGSLRNLHYIEGLEYMFSDRIPAPYLMTDIRNTGPEPIHIRHSTTPISLDNDSLDDNGVGDYTYDLRMFDDGGPISNLSNGKLYVNNPVFNKFAGRDKSVGVYTVKLESFQWDVGPLDLSPYLKNGYEVVFSCEEKVKIPCSDFLLGIYYSYESRYDDPFVPATHYEYLLMNPKTGEELYLSTINNISPYSSDLTWDMAKSSDGIGFGKVTEWGTETLPVEIYNDILGQIINRERSPYFKIIYNAPFDMTKSFKFPYNDTVAVYYDLQTGAAMANIGYYTDIAGNKVSIGTRIVKLENGYYATVDLDGNINADPSFKGKISDADGVVEKISANNASSGRDRSSKNGYNIGDIVTIAGVTFVLSLVGGVPMWIKSTASVPTPVAAEDALPEKAPKEKKDLSKYGLQQTKDGNWVKQLRTREGELYHSITYDENGIPISEYILKPGDGGCVRKEIFTNENGETYKISETGYDSENNRTFSSEESFNDKHEMTQKLTYDKNGNLIEEQKRVKSEHIAGNTLGDFDIVSEEYIEINRYDKDGNKIQSTWEDYSAEKMGKYGSEWSYELDNDAIREKLKFGRGKRYYK